MIALGAYDKNRRLPIPASCTLGQYCAVNLAESEMYGDSQQFANACEVVTASVRPAPVEPATGDKSGRLQHIAALYGACDAMQRLFQTIERLGPSSATVMILG